MYVPGFAAKLLVNGVRMKFTACDYNEVVDNMRCPNSEGVGGALVLPGYHVSINGLSVMQLTITDCSFDPLANVFFAPFNLGGGAFVAITLLLNGVGGNGFNLPTFHVTQGGGRIDVGGLQPITLSGESVGGWTFF